MRRYVLALLAWFGVLTVGLPSGSVQAAATQETFINTLPIVFQFEACNGEIVTVEGILHVVVHLTTDAKGGSLFATAGSFRNLVGTGDSGIVYRLSGGTIETVTDASVLEFSTIARFDVVSTGSTGNLTARNLVHITFTPSGEVTANVDRSTLSCGP